MANLTKWMKKEKRQMMTVWPEIVGDLTNATQNTVINNRIKKILEYNVLGGKQFRALILIYAYQLVTNKFTKENMRLVRIVAWCMEMIQAAAIMVDDLQDQSSFRRGKPCWYRCNQNELAAITDALKLQHCIFYLIKKNFKGKECYVDLLETFEKITLKTIDGQILDLQLSTNEEKPNLELFTMDTYNCIVRNKTSYYSVALPITIAMHLAGIKDRESFMQVESISLEIGHLFQVQDDFLDCFGDSEASGKDSTDIQDGKCTWFIVVALQRAAPEQRKILEECYGFLDPEKVKRVKQLYTDLNLQKNYMLYEDKVYYSLNKRVQQMSCGVPQKLFLNLLKTFYHRKS